MGASDGSREAAAAAAPGTLALTRFQTVAARTSLMRAPLVTGPQTWRTPEPGERMRRRTRDTALMAVPIAAATVAVLWLSSGWSPALLLAFPAVFGLCLWVGDEPQVAPEHAVTRIEVTVASDWLRVVQDGDTRIDSPWPEVAVWGFGEWEPPGLPGDPPKPPEVRELRLSGPDGRAITIDTFMFLDRAPVDAITWHLCEYGRIVMDAREWVIRRS